VLSRTTPARDSCRKHLVLAARPDDSRRMKVGSIQRLYLVVVVSSLDWVKRTHVTTKTPANQANMSPVEAVLERRLGTRLDAPASATPKKDAASAIGLINMTGLENKRQSVLARP